METPIQTLTTPLPKPGLPDGERAATSSAKNASARGMFLRLLIWLSIFAAWEAAYRIFRWRPYVFPAPSHILRALRDLLIFHTRQHGYASPLLMASFVSIVRLIVGFSVSILLGGALGLLMWRWDWLDRLMGGLFLGLQTLPSVCWVPLAMLTFGLNETGVLFVLVMGSFFAIAISLRDGLRTISPLYQRAGLMMGARGWRLYRYVLLPASMPAFVGSLRQGFSFAWRSLMGAELIFVVENDGLGALLSKGRDTGSIATVIALMMVMVCIGMLADRLVFARIQRAVYRRFGLI